MFNCLLRRWSLLGKKCSRNAFPKILRPLLSTPKTEPMLRLVTHIDISRWPSTWRIFPCRATMSLCHRRRTLWPTRLVPLKHLRWPNRTRERRSLPNPWFVHRLLFPLLRPVIPIALPLLQTNNSDSIWLKPYNEKRIVTCNWSVECWSFIAVWSLFSFFRHPSTRMSFLVSTHILLSSFILEKLYGMLVHFFAVKLDCCYFFSNLLLLLARSQRPIHR